MTRHRIMTQIKEEEKKNRKTIKRSEDFQLPQKRPQTSDSQDGSRTWK